MISNFVEADAEKVLSQYNGKISDAQDLLKKFKELKFRHNVSHVYYEDNYCENCTNCFNMNNSANCNVCIDCHFCKNCENCTSCLDCENCFNCKDCLRVFYSENCANQTNCLYCFGLHEINYGDDQYFVLNKKVSKQEFYDACSLVNPLINPIPKRN